MSKAGQSSGNMFVYGGALHKQKKEEAEDKEKAYFEEQKRKAAELLAVPVPKVGDQFTAGSSGMESALAQATMGFQTKEQFAQKRKELEKAEEEARKEKEGDKSAKKKKKKKKLESSLSFDMGDEDGEGEGEAAPAFQKKVGKNPNVDTNFLPDAEREEKEKQEKLELCRKWTEEQDKIKAEEIEVTYSYWDGKGHRGKVTIPKGTTIEKFLNKIRIQTKEIRNSPVDQLMYVKEDLIIPHNYSFYDLIISKARGKSGPLFKFNVEDDVRIGPLDTRVEKEDSHAGKVVEKRWYEKNKGEHPAARWEIYDPAVKRDSYSIYGEMNYGVGVNTALMK